VRGNGGGSEYVLINTRTQRKQKCDLNFLYNKKSLIVKILKTFGHSQVENFMFESKKLCDKHDREIS
jgi:hypothetical protein